jgi:trehalose synthase
VTPKDYQVYVDALDQNLMQMKLDADIVFIHDPQPAALVKKRREQKNHWIWRCHIDLSWPDPHVCDFLKPYKNGMICASFLLPIWRNLSRIVTQV